MRQAGRAASPDMIDEARRFTDAVRLKKAKTSLASRQLGLLDCGIGEAEITDPRLTAVPHELEAGRIRRLAPERNAALGAVAATSVIPSELNTRLAENGFDLPSGHLDRRAFGLALLRTTVDGFDDVEKEDAGASARDGA